MANLALIVAIIGNIIAILMFLTPVKTFRRVVKCKSTENFKGISYVTTLLSTILWTLYGILKPGGFLIATVNATGTLLQAAYVTLYLIYAPKQTRVKYLKLVGVLDIGVPSILIAVLLLGFHGSRQLTILGFIVAGLTLGMYASPLAAMRMVIKTKTVEYMPFTLSFFLFLNAGIWSAYAVLVNDYFIGVPNAIGFVMGSGQLIVYMVYRNKSSEGMIATTKSIEKIEEEGSAILVAKDLEMGVYKVQKKKERTYNTERSLPKSTLSQQHSFQKIMKACSLSKNELKAIWSFVDEVKATENVEVIVTGHHL